MRIEAVQAFAIANGPARDGIKIASSVSSEAIITRDFQLTNFTGKRVNDLGSDAQGPFDDALNFKQQAFRVVFSKTAGQLQHRSGSYTNEDTLPPAQLIKLISGASRTFTNTAGGTNSSTAIATGLKINSADTSMIIFDTPAQVPERIYGPVIVSYNDSDTAITGDLQANSINVNGVTRTCMCIRLRDVAPSSAFALPGAMDNGEHLFIKLVPWLTPPALS